ncbi:MAG: thioredoxin family protein [Firmicutes bacterium]|nr:thioredoxin family protein [Candidatus Fermentithermobacillaceae bacterium]
MFEKEWLERALSFQEYVDKAEMNVPTIKANYEDTQISEEDHKYFASLSSKLEKGAIKVLALSEPWCGDCVENLPIVAKLASLYPCFDLLVFSRDDNLDIMDRYLTDGKRVIPVFVFFDEEGQEIGRFIERPQGARDFLARETEKHKGLSEEERQKAMYGVRTRLRKLYKTQFRDETIKEIRRILETRYEPEDA